MKQRLMRVLVVAGFAAFMLCTSMAVAAVPLLMNYQGKLNDNTGLPVSGTKNMIFSLYSVATGTPAVWTETQSVTVTNGMFNVILGSQTTLDPMVFDNTEVWLGIKVGSDQEMTPRQRITSTAYAMKAASMEVSAVTSSAIAAGAVTDDKITGPISGAKLGSHSHPGTDITSTVASALNAEMINGQRVTDLDARYAVQVPRQNTLTSLSIKTLATSITIGADGLPIISHYTGTVSSTLEVVKCGNAFCSSGNTQATIDSSGVINAIIIGADGLPIISYYDAPNTRLMTAKCGNASCSSGNSINVVDSTGSVGNPSSITIGTDGLPIISYYDATNLDLKVAKCGDASCSSGNTINVVDSAGSVGSYSSIAIGSDGLPVISYTDSTNSDLKVAKCGDASCSSGNTLNTVDSAGFVGRITSLTIGADGLPIISYYDNTNLDLKVVKCGDASCSSGNVVTTVDSAGDVGSFGSINLGADGLPVISYYDATNFDLKVLKCGNVYCSSGNTISTLDSTGVVGSFNSITIGTDGLPVISYRDITNDSLKVAKCATQSCVNNWGRR